MFDTMKPPQLLPDPRVVRIEIMKHLQKLHPTRYNRNGSYFENSTCFAKCTAIRWFLIRSAHRRNLTEEQK